MGETSKLKISIWKSYIPDATLILAPPATSTENESERSVRELSSDGVGLHKEVYSWRMADDPFGGVVSSERREALSVLLRDQLTIEIQPTERTIAKLRAFIEQAKADMDAGVEWSGSQSYCDDRSYFDVTARSCERYRADFYEG